jgi:hypothetical protein
MPQAIRFGIWISRIKVWSKPVPAVTLAGIALGFGARPAAAQNYQVLVYFTGQPVGIPAGITFGKDPQGKAALFGVAFGGNGNCNGSCGLVFQLDESGTQTVLYTFQGGNDGWEPNGYLIQDVRGNLYGTTFFGGTGQCTMGGSNSGYGGL